jgi:poly(rC)-binding protein 2/3/4
VGSVIGKAGRKINEIRQKSGSHVKIEDEMSGAAERLVTIRGLPENNQMALYLLYQRLEEEKARSTTKR